MVLCFKKTVKGHRLCPLKTNDPSVQASRKIAAWGSRLSVLHCSPQAPRPWAAQLTARLPLAEVTATCLAVSGTRHGSKDNGFPSSKGILG